jgi:amino-acid N-acetyltransferase
MSGSVTLREVDVENVARVETVLEENDLPSRDVRTKPQCFYLAYSDTEFVGIGGLETYGVNGLLRSIVVTESNRRRGYGTAVCDALEARARTDGVRTLYLLTTTAAPFFRGRGYEVIDREDVPSSIRRTTEFEDLCPSSAVCMARPL